MAVNIALPATKRTMTRRDRAVLDAVTSDDAGKASGLLSPWRVLGDDLFELFYQAKVDARSQQVVGVEALLRTRERGFLTAADAIALAERTGCIRRMGEWVASTACRQMSSWREAGLKRPFAIAVNVSAHQLRDAEFAAHLLAAMQRARILTRDIQIELTETTLIEDFATAERVLNNLREAGVQVAVDDFGTGHASLRYLTRLPVDQVKLDRSYVQQIGRNRSAENFIKAVIKVATKLRLEVVGEGVETLGQAHFLRLHGCTSLQGYYFGRPLPAPFMSRRLLAHTQAPVRPPRKESRVASDPDAFAPA